LVRVLATNAPVSGSSVDFKVLTSAFSPSQGQSAQLVAGGTLLSWDGTSDNGSVLKSGSYWVQYDQSDAYGNVASSSKAISVIQTSGSFQVKVFNSAGEEVADLSGLQMISGTAPSHIVASKSTLDSSASGSVLFDLGSGSVSWDGTGAGGKKLASGVYTVQLSVKAAGGAGWIQSVQVTLLNAGGNPLGTLQAGPSPWKQSADPSLVLVNGVSLREMDARLYNLAGELVLEASSLNSGTLTLSAPKGRLASGVYLLVVNGEDIQGNIERKTLKICIFN
jgi:hypothetical protein